MTEVWLGVIAVAVAIMAAIQVGAIVVGIRVAKRVDRLTTDFEREVKPLIKNLTEVAAEAQRAAQLATMQVERADRLFGNLAVSAEQTMSVVSRLVGSPAGNGLALLSAARTAFSAFRELRSNARRKRAEREDVHDEESLFIG